MVTTLHKNATTTLSIRAPIQEASGSDSELVARSVADGDHTNRQATTLNHGQEELVAYLRTQVRLCLDELLKVVREFIEPEMSRSALACLLVRHGHARLPAPEASAGPSKPFDAYEPGYLNVDLIHLPQRACEAKRRFVFVAIDRATLWVYIAIKNHKTATAAKSFLNALAKAAPFKIHSLFTNNGKEFTDRLFGQRAKEPCADHEFDALCSALGIDHRLIRAKSLQTNGLVERSNGRVEQVLRPRHFDSAPDLKVTLNQYAWLANEQAWRKSHPYLFVEQDWSPAPEADLIGLELPGFGGSRRRRLRRDPPGALKYDPDRLLNMLCDKLKLSSDAALADALQVSAAILSRVRRSSRGVTAAMLLAMHDVTGLTIRDLRWLMGD